MAESDEHRVRTRGTRHSAVVRHLHVLHGRRGIFDILREIPSRQRITSAALRAR
jgi:hypothetical protein